jgi:hypothetical protein
MRTNILGKLGLLVITISMLAIMAGCTNTATSISQQPTTTSHTTGQPIEILSVRDTYQSGQTVIPAGPTIEITLKNVSNESIISLNVTLEELGDRTYAFDFYVTSSNPLAPNEQISCEQTLIGGGWGGGIPYSLTINGTMESGETFTFTWEPAD